MQIISEIFPDPEETNNYILLRNDWRKVTQKFVELNIILNHKVEFSEQDIDELRYNSHRFLVRGLMWFMKLGDTFFLKEE